MTSVDIEVTIGDPEFFDSIEDPQKFTPIFMKAAETIVIEFINLISVYPPTTEANEPGRVSLVTHRPMGYYERGRGWWYPVTGFIASRGVRTIKPGLGTPKTRSVEVLRAAGFEGVSGYKLKASSEKMGKSWEYDIQMGSAGPLAIVSNTAGYSGLVVGQEQTALNAARDWPNVEDIWNSRLMDLIVHDALVSAINEYYHIEG